MTQARQRDSVDALIREAERCDREGDDMMRVADKWISEAMIRIDKAAECRREGRRLHRQAGQLREWAEQRKGE